MSSDISNVIEKQKHFFDSGITRQISYRIETLRKLRLLIIENEKKIIQAMKKDLGKSAFETYMCEIGLTLTELTYMIKHTRKFSKNRCVRTPIAQFASKSIISPTPYGNVLVMSPWNYPFMLSMEPLIDAVAAGNTVIVKPSAYAPNTSKVMESLINNNFDSGYLYVVTGGREENKELLSNKFDYIFFTGGKKVGQIVMQKASFNLTPITLELGGKSPCIVDKTANIKLAAKRIVFGKYLNCGQTCVAPDYIYCEETVKEKLINELKKQIRKQYGESPIENSTYGKIINDKHFNRILHLIDEKKVIYGGNYSSANKKIEPTIMDHVTFEDAVMGEEIFGPVLPILTYKNIKEAIMKVNSMSHPLALYLFSTDRKNIKNVMKYCQFGGGCINDTIIHLATTNMGFGGVGESGMGSYHGKSGFDTFTHYRSIIDKKNFIDLPMRYQPYKNVNFKLLRLFLK